MIIKTSHGAAKQDYAMPPPTTTTIVRRNLPANLLALLCLGSLAETVLEAAGKVAHESHATGTLSAAALGLVVVVEAAHLGALTETAGSASRLLNIVRRLSAPPADDVGLVVTGACAADTFRHGCEERWTSKRNLKGTLYCQRNSFAVGI